MSSVTIKRKPFGRAEKTAAIADYMQDCMVAILRSSSLDEARTISLRALCQMNLVENLARLPSPIELEAAVKETVMEWNKKQAEANGNN